MVLPPVLDYLFYRFKKDNLGLWDTLYGGVWMVRTTKTAEAKGWLKRLEQLMIIQTHKVGSRTRMKVTQVPRLMS